MDYYQPNGIWDYEPDYAEFIHDGLDCVIWRNTKFNYALCGYVGVPPGHPAFGLGYNDSHPCLEPLLHIETSIDNIGVLTAVIGALSDDEEPRATPVNTLQCHQGITYASSWKPRVHRDQSGWVSGVMRSVPYYQRWWFGFDASHSGDYGPRQPMLDGFPLDTGGIYRDFEYMTRRTRELAEQLASVS